MSWLGGLNDSFNQLTSITGQIGGQLSNFTKEVLTETAEDNIDYEVEAKRLAEELKHSEASTVNLKQENEALKEKITSAELHISTSGIELEAKLREKNNEIALLKQKLSSNGDVIGDIGNPTLTSSYSNVSLHDDDEDFHDVISFQREINRLSRELDEARNEAEKWKEKASTSQHATTFNSQQSSDEGLAARIKELENALRRESDHHQQEMRSMQDAHSALISRHQEEIRKLQHARPAAPEGVATASDGATMWLKQENEKLKTELNSVKEQMRTRNRQLQMQKKQLEELGLKIKEREEELEEVKESKKLIVDEKAALAKEKHVAAEKSEKIEKELSRFLSVDTIPLEFDKTDVVKSLLEFMQYFDETLREKTSVIEENLKYKEDVENLQSRILELEQKQTENDSPQQETDSIGDAELAESDQWHQEGINQAAEEDQNIESDRYQRQHLPSHIDFGTPLRHSSPQVSSVRRKLVRDDLQPVTPQAPGDLTLTLQALQKQVEDYEHEIEEYEKVQSEWQVEKKSLQDLLNRYQNEVGPVEDKKEPSITPQQPKDERTVTLERLKQELNDLREARGALERETNRLAQEKEQLQVATKSLEEELNSSSAEILKERDHADALKSQLDKFQNEKEKLQAACDVLTQELNKSREEKDDLDQALDALDTQHQDEMAQVLTVRDDLKEQLKTAQNRIKLEMDAKNDLEKKLGSLKMNLEQDSVGVSEKIASLEEENRILESKMEDSVKNLGMLQEEFEQKKEIIEDLKKEKLDLCEKMIELQEEGENLKMKILEKDEKCVKLEKDVENLGENLGRKQDEFSRILKDKDAEILSLTDQKEEESLQKSTRMDVDESMRKNLEDSLQKKDEMIKILKSEKDNLEERFSSEVMRLQEEIEGLGAELENSGREMAETQSKHEGKLREVNVKHQENVTRIEQEFAEKMKNLNSSKKDFENEAKATNKVYLEKIAHLEKLNTDFQQKLEILETDDVRMFKMSEEHETLVENLKQQLSSLTEQYNTLLEQHAVIKNSAQNEKTQLENKIKFETEQKIVSQKEVTELKNLLQKSKNAENSLVLELEKLKQELELSRVKISELAEYETANNSLRAEIEELKLQLSSGLSRSDTTVEEMFDNLKKHDFAGLEKADLSKDDIGSLLQLIKERDNVIEVLRQKQSICDQSSNSVDIKRLEDANRSLTAEKDQILAVISEKTRENRKLKDDAHKMMDVVAESRAALEKVQQENAALLAKYEGYDKEMTKEAVTKLSRLVREKELEIESLQRKCGTLLEVLQQQPSAGSEPAMNAVSGQQVQNLLADRETLTTQVQQLLNERNHLVALLNQRQVEVDEARLEVSKAAEALERDSDNNSKLQIDYGNLVHDYDQTQMKLASVQKELTNLKEKSAELENLKNSFLNKLESASDLRPVIAVETLQTSDHSPRGGGSVDQAEVRSLNEKLSKVSEILTVKENLMQKLNLEIEMSRNDLKEKDILIHRRTEEMNRAKKDLTAKTNEVEILRKSVENLREQVSGLSRNCDEARSEVRTFSSRLQEKEAESQAFQETNAQLSMLLKEKEYELENSKEKCERLESMAKESQEGKESESQKLMVELDNAKQTVIAARHERDQVMLSLKQKKLEGDKYAEEARTLREKEGKLESELARLRNHLIQVEEAYTQEAVLAEERAASLREQLEQTRCTNTAAREASVMSQQQAESLQEQLRTAIAQRDQAIQQVQLSQEQGMQYATALQKLQVAVERMQREEAANFAEQLGKVKVQLELKTNDANTFETMANDLKVKLENANEALKSASRLNKQLELKEENITQLKNIVGDKQLRIDDLTDKLHLITTKNEGMVDKEIIKNLVIGYFTSPNNKRPDVLRLIMGVLNFSQMDTDKVNSGQSQGGARGWIGGWLWRGGDPQHRPSMSVPASPRGAARTNESFAQMFVKFLENESVPHQAAKLPTAAMINEAQQKRRPPLSPGLSSVPTPIGFTAAERAGPTVAGRYSPYLLSSSPASTVQSAQIYTPASVSHPIALTPVLPTFTPIINPKPAAEQEILKDILLNGNDR